MTTGRAAGPRQAALHGQPNLARVQYRRCLMPCRSDSPSSISRPGAQHTSRHCGWPRPTAPLDAALEAHRAGTLLSADGLATRFVACLSVPAADELHSEALPWLMRPPAQSGPGWNPVPEPLPLPTL